MSMLEALVDGYGSSDDSDNAGGENDVSRSEELVSATTKPVPDQFKDAESAASLPAQVPAKRKLPSARAAMQSTSSWAREGTGEPAIKQVDDVGTKYHNVAPPVGCRAEDGVMGGGGDYIRPVMGGSVSLDPSKVYTGKRTLAAGGRLIPPQVRGRKNVNTEDVESWTAKKAKKADGHG